MARHIRYGVIGCGMMGREHLRNIALLPNAGVAAIFEPDAAMREGQEVAAGRQMAALLGFVQVVIAEDGVQAAEDAGRGVEVHRGVGHAAQMVLAIHDLHLIRPQQTLHRGAEGGDRFAQPGGVGLQLAAADGHFRRR